MARHARARRPLPRLRHRAYAALARPTLHPGPDLRPRQGTPGRCGQTLEATGCQDKNFRFVTCCWTGASIEVAVFRYLQAARTPFLMPAIAAWSQAHGNASGRRHPSVSVLQEEWLVQIPGHRASRQAESDRVAGRAMPQPCRAQGQTGSLCLVVCLLGDESRVASLGASSLPSAFWYRNQLSADERGARPDQQPQRGVAAVVRGVWRWCCATCGCGGIGKCWPSASRQASSVAVSGALLPLKAAHWNDWPPSALQDFGGLKVIHLPQPPATKRQ